MVFIPGRYDNEEDRTRRLEARDFRPSPKWRLVVLAGLIVLVAFGILAIGGFPGAGIILVPIGLGMVIGGGLQVVLDLMSG